jgi:hypothetical protein
VSAEETDSSAQTDVSDDVVATVAAEMSSHGLRPLSDDELLQREVWRAEWHQRDEQRRQRDEQQRLEHQAAQAEATRREAAIAAQEAREKAQHELRERRAREVRQHEIAGLHLQAARHESFRRNVETAARRALVQQNRQAMVAQYENVFNALDQKLNPPPAPEPSEVVYVEEDRGPPKLDYPVLRRWFERE